jgi:predicted aspartyl protease
VILLTVLPLWNSAIAQTAGIDSATVPLYVDGDRPFVDLMFTTADGSKRSARFWVDTGGGGFLLTETLARGLGLKWGDAFRQEGREFARVLQTPEPSLGELPLELSEGRVLVILGSDNMLPASAPGHADGLVPGHVLASYHVIFDYPNRLFTLARAGTVRPVGDPLPMPVSDQMGFPRTELEVDGVKHGFLLDTGASFTMISAAILSAWSDQHPEWLRYEGAAGDAVMLGGQTLETMFVPTARWGTREIRPFGVVSQQTGVFERGMSRMMTSPIVGALGGNVLKHFRVELDYAARCCTSHEFSQELADGPTTISRITSGCT